MFMTSLKAFFAKQMMVLRQSWYRGQFASFDSSVKLSPLAMINYPQKIAIGADCKISDHAVLRANSRADCAIRLGRAVQVSEFALIGANDGTVKIGDRCWIAPYCLIYGNGHVELGNDVLLGPRVSINTVSHHAESVDVSINSQGIYTDPVIIEDDVWIGMHAVILQGVRIGRGSIIGAGTLVNSDIPPYSVAIGVPAKVIRNRQSQSSDDLR